MRFHGRRLKWSLAVTLLVMWACGCSEDEPAADPASWERLGGTDAPIHALVEYRGRLVFGGEFARVHAFGPDEEVHHLAAFAEPEAAASEGETWDPVFSVTDEAGTWYDLNPEPNGAVYAATVFRGELIVAGAFTYIGPIPAAGIAAWDGATWRALGDGIDGISYALARDGDDRLYAGGSFTGAGGAPAARVARWDGNAWSALGDGTSATVYALHVRGGVLVAGGAFHLAGGRPANHVARWNGAEWLPLDVGVDGIVRALTSTQGSLIAGGDFTTVNGYPMNHVARWIGSAWLSLGGGPVGFESVNAFAVAADELVAAGTAPPAGSAPGSLAAWDGEAWTGESTVPNGSALALVLYRGHPVAAVDLQSESGLYRPEP